jgi:hypothetical protein
LRPIAGSANLIVVKTDRGPHSKGSRECPPLAVHSLLLFGVRNITLHEYPSGNHVGHLIVRDVKYVSAFIPHVTDDKIEKILPMTAQTHQRQVCKILNRTEKN